MKAETDRHACHQRAWVGPMDSPAVAIGETPLFCGHMKHEPVNSFEHLRWTGYIFAAFDPQV